MAAHVHNSLLRAPRPLSWFFVVVSVLGHALFFVLMLGFLERPKAKTTFVQKPIRASLVRLGKPRDPTLLPRQETAPAPPPASNTPAPPAPIPPAPSPPAVSVPSPKAPTTPPPQAPSSTKPSNTSSSLLSAFSREAREAKTSSPPQGEADGDPMGDSAIQEGERYFGLISAAVSRQYNVSASIPENQRSRLEAFVLIRIASNGKPLESKLTKSSGNLLFDAAVESALKLASPFPPPPEHLKELLRKDGVQLRFTP